MVERTWIFIRIEVNSHLSNNYNPRHSCRGFVVYKAALALVFFLWKPTSSTKSLERQRKNTTIYCHAQARIWGLQADPQTLAEPHAHIKRPARLQSAQLPEDLPWWTERYQKAYALFTFITRFARFNEKRSRPRCHSAKVIKGELSITTDRRETLVFLWKSRDSP